MTNISRQNLSTLFFLILTNFSLYGQTRVKQRGWLTGNNIVEFVQDKKDKQFFKDPVDDTTNFKNVIDNIFKDNNGKIYILNTCFRPMGNDTLLNLEYYDDVSDFLDLKTYRQINGGYFQNKGKVYMWQVNSDGDYPIEVTGADPETFTPFDSISGGIDKKYVFYGDTPNNIEIIKGADPKTIKLLNPGIGCLNCGNYYFADDKSVYFGLIKIEGADSKTFRLVNKKNIDAKDKYGKYFEGKLIR